MHKSLILFAALTAGATSFAEDAYIEATGTQAVGLGLKMKPTTRWEVDFALTDKTAQQRVFGVGTGKGQLILYVNGEQKYSFGASKPTPGGYPTSMNVDTSRHIAIGDGPSGRGYIVTGGVTNAVSAAFQVTETSECPLAIFGYASNAEATEFGFCAKARVYGAKVYEGTTLVRDLVPRVFGGEAGFYDCVGKGFYPSGVAGEPFLYGGDLEDPFVVSDGTQFVNTGYLPKKTSKFAIDYAIEPINASYEKGGVVQARLIAASESPGTLVSTIYVAGTAGGTDANIAFCSGDGWTGNSVWTGKGFDNQRRTAILDVGNRTGVLQAGGATVSTKSTGVATLDSTRPLGLFGQVSADGTTGYYKARMKLYNFRIYEGDVLVRDYRPFVKDGTVGLLDAVERTSFLAPGANGTALACGGPIESNGRDDAYLSSDGSQILNTSYLPKLNSRIEIDFALNSHTGKQERVFGATLSDDFRYGLRCTGTEGNGDFALVAGDFTDSGTVPSYNTTVKVDLARHRAIIDLKNKKLYFITGSVTNFTANIANRTKASSWPLYIFGEPYAKTGGTQNRSAMRLYSLKIYEDDQLVQYWLPFKDASRIGAKEVLSGTVRQDGRSSSVPFRVGGCGWDEDGSAFYGVVGSPQVSKRNPSVLTAFAPSALSYQWFCDGARLDGATDATYEVAWKGSPYEYTYSVAATFDVNGSIVERYSDPFLVTMDPPGLLVIFK